MNCWECGKPAVSVCMGPHPGFKLRFGNSRHVERTDGSVDVSAWEAIVLEREMARIGRIAVLPRVDAARLKRKRRDAYLDFQAKRTSGQAARARGAA